MAWPIKLFWGFVFCFVLFFKFNSIISERYLSFQRVAVSINTFRATGYTRVERMTM